MENMSNKKLIRTGRILRTLETTMTTKIAIVLACGSACLLLGGCAHYSVLTVEREYYPDGKLEWLASRDSNDGFHGRVLAFYPSGKVFEDSYREEGKVVSGVYYDGEGKVISRIINGTGFRRTPYKGQDRGFEEYRNGEFIRGAH